MHYYIIINQASNSFNEVTILATIDIADFVLVATSLKWATVNPIADK